MSTAVWLTAQLDSFKSVQTESEESRFEELEPTTTQHMQQTPKTVQLDSFNSIQTDSENSRIEELVSNAEQDGTRVGNMQMDKVEGMEELMGEDGTFEEFGANQTEVSTSNRQENSYAHIW